MKGQNHMKGVTMRERNVFIIIPARFKSSRYPGKPLALIANEYAIVRTMRSALKVSGVTGVYVATDDTRIKNVIEHAGGNVIMTSESCKNGTERVAEAVASLDLSEDDIIVNFQGDAPLTPPWFVESIIKKMDEVPDAEMVTPVIACDVANYRRFKHDRSQGRVGATTVVFDKSLRAIYFSKEVIPYINSEDQIEVTPVFHHVGLYAYRLKSLLAYPTWSMGPLETAEQLEQLRFLEEGKSTYVAIVDSKGCDFWELNNPEDIAIIEDIMARNPNRD